MYSTKKEMIYETLKEEIIEGEYEFGERLILSQLAKRFSSSEIPVREAISQLSSDKLVEFKPHVGAVVSTLTSKDISEIFEMRIELEGLATRLAVERLEEKDIYELREIIEASKVAFNERDYDLFEKQNKQFHMEIYSYSNNELLVKTIDELWSNTKRYPSLFKENDEHVKLSIQEHEEILDALVKKDSMMAEQTVMKHKIRAGEQILSLTQREFYKRLNAIIDKQHG